MNLPEIVDLQKVLVGHSFRLSCHSVAADPQDKAVASYLKVVRLKCPWKILLKLDPQRSLLGPFIGPISYVLQFLANSL